MNEMANIDIQIVFRVYKSILSENVVGENEITTLSPLFRRIKNLMCFEAAASSLI